MTRKQRKFLIKRIEKEVEAKLAKAESLEILSDEYNQLWDEIKKLEELKNSVKSTKHKFVIEKEWIPVIGSIASILLIMNYEKADVLTTKAIGFIKKA